MMASVMSTLRSALEDLRSEDLRPLSDDELEERLTELARHRRMIEAELGQGSEGVPAADILAARKTIVTTTIRLSREGAFELPSTQNAA